MRRQLPFEDVADRREVFWMSNIYRKEGLPIPLPASDSIKLPCMCEQGIEVADDLLRLFMRFADV